MNCKIPEDLYLKLNTLRKTHQSTWNDLIAYLISYSLRPVNYQRNYELNYKGKVQYFTLRFHEDNWIEFAKFCAYFKTYVHCLDYLMNYEDKGLNLNKKIGF